jgi:hypothetical protein
LDDARIGGKDNEERPEVERMGNEKNVEREKIVFCGEPRKMKDVVEDEYGRCDKESEEHLFFIGAGYFKKYIKNILPSQQEYSSSIYVPSTIYYRILNTT